jgi:hypothetical protein
MGELEAERAALADHLEAIGFNVILFERLGGREEDAETAYLAGVEQADIYVGIVADQYGRMDAKTGYSATHAEYRRALAIGRRIAVWVRSDGDRREGAARSFVDELQTFHTTGVFSNPGELARGVERRLAEIGADEDSPWVKVGDTVFRAGRIYETHQELVIEGVIRDESVRRYLTGLRPQRVGGSNRIPVATIDRAGQVVIRDVAVNSRSRTAPELTVTASVGWAEGRGGSMDAGTTGFTADDLTEVGLNCALLGQPLPDRINTMLGRVLVDTTDPVADLVAVRLSEGNIEPIARLLVVEHLLGKGRASAINQFMIGPANRGQRRVRLVYTEPQRYTNVTPGVRTLDGTRNWQAL